MTTTSDANGSTVDGFESAVATVAFVDLAGFSAIADVYGDVSAIAGLGCFEELVRQALGELGAPIKWIGDEAMFGFPEPATALQVLGRLLLSKGEKGEKGLREGAERVRQRALCSRRDGPNVSLMFPIDGPFFIGGAVSLNEGDTRFYLSLAPFLRY